MPTTSTPDRLPLLIDTAVVPASERLEFWSESTSGVYHPLQIRSAVNGEFWATMSGYELGPLGVFRIAAAANTMIRTVRAIADGDPERVHLCAVLRGQLDVAQGDRTGVACAGDVIGYETSHPAVVRAREPFEALVLRIPRQLLGGRAAAQVRDLAGARIPAGHAPVRTATSFFKRLAGEPRNGSARPADASRTVERVLDIVEALAVVARQEPGPRQPRSRAEILLHIESFIEEHLDDPCLDPDGIARASFISTRYVHKLFEAEGTSLCRWIRTLRLERCRRDLVDPALDHWTILAIATRWGLPGPQHFSRLFRAAYGCSPTELRREARRNGAWAATRPAGRRRAGAGRPHAAPGPAPAH